MRRLVLESYQSPGDVLMLTAAVRDLHLGHPGKFQTDVRTSTPGLWENNPHLTSLDPRLAGVESIRMEYPLIHRSNQAPYHFIHGYVQFLEHKLGLRVPVTAFKGDVHISPLEKSWMSQIEERGISSRFWIMMAGGKYDFTTKWWNPANYQRVVDYFRGRILFVQCGEAQHWHPPLKGVINLIGKTDIRQFVRLMYHADGVVCPVTFAMHLAAAVETKPGWPPNRACIVIAGGREPPQWEAYPHHQFISTNGALDCCDNGGCWKSRCQPIGDGDKKDSDLCIYPVQVTTDLRIPKCMSMITPEDVIRCIEMYYEGGTLKYDTATDEVAAEAVVQTNGSRLEVLPWPQRMAPREVKGDEIANDWELRVFGLQRSGIHAVVNWIIQQTKGPTWFVNDIKGLSANPFRENDCHCFPGNPSGLSAALRARERAGRHTQKEYLLLGYEDTDLSTLPRDFDEVLTKCVGRSRCTRNVLIVRDPFNLFASRMAFDNTANRNPITSCRDQVIALWKAHAREALEESSYLGKDKVVVNYNRWFADRTYRQKVAAALGLTFSDFGLQMVPGVDLPQTDFPRFGCGSSFDNQKFHGRAQKMEVLARWKRFQGNSLYRQFFDDSEVLALSNRLFGEIPGTSSLRNVSPSTG